MWHDPISADFAQALLNPSLAKPAGIIGPNGKASDKRFNVYRNNVAYSLVEALGKNYPVVKVQCGDAKFSDAAQLYFSEHPPRTKIMFQLGVDFDGWLGGFAPAKAQMPWLADLARLERFWLDAYHAEDAAPLDPVLISAIAPDLLGDMRFVKHPAAALISSPFSIHSMFEAGRNGMAKPNPRHAQNVLVTRPHFNVETTLLDDGAAAFLSRLFAGQTLGQAAEAAFAQTANFDFSASLGTIFQSGAATALC